MIWSRSRPAVATAHFPSGNARAPARGVKDDRRAFDSGGSHERDTSPSRCNSVPHRGRQGSGATDNLARHGPMDHSQAEYRCRRDARQGRAKGGLRGGGGQGNHHKLTAAWLLYLFQETRIGRGSCTAVEVYLLRVKERLKKWPEKGERKLSWVSTNEAVSLIEEPGVVPLLLRLMELEDDLVIPARKRSFKPGAADRA